MTEAPPTDQPGLKRRPGPDPLDRHGDPDHTHNDRDTESPPVSESFIASLHMRTGTRKGRVSQHAPSRRSVLKPGKLIRVGRSRICRRPQSHVPTRDQSAPPSRVTRKRRGRARLGRQERPPPRPPPPPAPGRPRPSAPAPPAAASSPPAGPRSTCGAVRGHGRVRVHHSFTARARAGRSTDIRIVPSADFGLCGLFRGRRGQQLYTASHRPPAVRPLTL